MYKKVLALFNLIALQFLIIRYLFKPFSMTYISEIFKLKIF
jgi:hypothetical protein